MTTSIRREVRPNFVVIEQFKGEVASPKLNSAEPASRTCSRQDRYLQRYAAQLRPPTAPVLLKALRAKVEA